MAQDPQSGGKQGSEKGKKKKTKRALIIVDMQNDFIPPNGSFAVPGGDTVVEKVNFIRKKYGKKFDCVVCSMDWHPPNHCSFLSNNIKRDANAKLFSKCKLADGVTMQVMWPDHCVQGTDGAKIHKDLIRKQSDKIILKGLDSSVDSYSAFMDNDKKSKTALEGLLKEEEITDIYCVGLAYDYCLGNTAIDGSKYFNSFIIKEASASVAQESEKEIEQLFKKHNVNVMPQISSLENLPDRDRS